MNTNQKYLRIEGIIEGKAFNFTLSGEAYDFYTAIFHINQELKSYELRKQIEKAMNSLYKTNKKNITINVGDITDDQYTLNEGLSNVDLIVI